MRHHPGRFGLIVLLVASCTALQQLNPAAAQTTPWSVIVQMVIQFTTKLAANEASRYIHKEEYDELKKRLSMLEAQVASHRGSDASKADYHDVLASLQSSRRRLVGCTT